MQYFEVQRLSALQYMEAGTYQYEAPRRCEITQTLDRSSDPIISDESTTARPGTATKTCFIEIEQQKDTKLQIQDAGMCYSILK